MAVVVTGLPPRMEAFRFTCLSEETAAALLLSGVPVPVLAGSLPVRSDSPTSEFAAVSAVDALVVVEVGTGLRTIYGFWEGRWDIREALCFDGRLSASPENCLRVKVGLSFSG
jgi:hypothetical protein